MTTIEITGIKEIIGKLDKMGNKKIYNDVLKQTGEKAVAYAKMFAPEMTGAMMRSINGSIHGNTFSLMCTAPYAIFNEFGTIFMSAGTPDSPFPVTSTSGKYAFRPFLRPAMHRAFKEAPEIFSKEFMKVWK